MSHSWVHILFVSRTCERNCLDFKSMWTRFRSANTPISLQLQCWPFQNQYLLQWTVWYSYIAFNQFKCRKYQEPMTVILFWFCPNLNESDHSNSEIVIRSLWFTWVITLHRNEVTIKSNENERRRRRKQNWNVEGTSLQCYVYTATHTPWCHIYTNTDLHFIWQ